MAKHRMTRHKTNWRFTLRWYKYRIAYQLGRLVKAYITRGKA
jgi:hypothetical protein